MIWAWDKNKARQNFMKHSVGFEEALTVFGDPFVASFEDPDHAHGEQRYLTIEYSDARRLLVLLIPIQGMV